MLLEPITRENLTIYLFSFNRGRFLENCLESVNQCAASFDVTVIDDQSEDPLTQEVLARYEDSFRILTAGKDDDPEHKTGGLYNNMQYAFNEAREQGKEYVLFLQDDMQLIRVIQDEDLHRATRFFEANPNSAELQTCFMKRRFRTKDDQLVSLDPSKQAYLRPNDYAGFSGFSAVGLFNLNRFNQLFGELRKGEYANNEHAQESGIQMGLTAYPFMMWLPYPISHRGKQRNMQLQLVEALAGCDFHPYRIMDEATAKNFINRNLSNKPYAEEWLTCPSVGRAPVWSFAGGLPNLFARGGIRYWVATMLQKFR